MPAGRRSAGPDPPWLALVLLATGMAAFGSATPVAKLVGEGFPTYLGSALRVALGALVLLPFAISELGSLRGRKRGEWLALGGVALFGMFGFTVLLFHGMRSISGVLGSIVMSTTPAVTAAGAFLFLGNPLGWHRVTAIALAVAGVVVMHLGSGEEAGAGSERLLGSLLVFGAVCCEAAYTLLGKVAARSLSPVLVSFAGCTLALPLFVPLGLAEISGFDPGGVPLTSWLALLWWGGGTLALGSVLWYSGLARVAGTTAAGFMGVMPVSALLLSYVLLGEEFRWLHLTGFSIVFAGVLLISWGHARGAEEEHG